MSAVIGRRSAGLIAFTPNSTIEAERQAREAAQEEQNRPATSGLAAEVRRQFDAARSARNSKTDEILLDCLRRRNGEYSPQKLTEIRSTGGSEVFMMLTSIKVRAAIAWVSDIMFGTDKPYGCEPTPEPDLTPEMEQLLAGYVQAEAQDWMAQAQFLLPPQALQQRFAQLADQLKKRLTEVAKQTAKRMETRIDDQFTEGGWKEAMKEVISDIMTYPVAILRGPVLRKRKTLEWSQQGGKWAPIVSEAIRPEWYRVSPFDFWFSASSRNVQDGWIFERHRLRRADILAMRGVPGYSTDSINAAVLEYGKRGLRSWLYGDQERAVLEGRPNELLYQGDTIDVIEGSGSASGAMLKEWGVEGITDPVAEYECNVWLIGTYVIRAALNPNPLGERGYYTASFEQIPGAAYGKSLVQVMSDTQDVCNAAARSLVNNMAIGSGPMADINTERLAPGEQITNLYPWRIFQTLNDPHGTNTPAIRFFQPETNVDKLLKIFEYFSAIADEVTGIPKYEYGQSSGGGAGSTASGLSMLMSSAARGIKQVISHLDTIIEGAVQYQYYWNMMYSEDDDIKGDLKMVATTSRSLVAKEQQQIRRNELLQTTNNPVDLQIMGLEGRAELLRGSISSFEDDHEKIIPDRETLMLRQAQVQQAQMIQQQAAQTLDASGKPVSGQDHALFQGAA